MIPLRIVEKFPPGVREPGMMWEFGTGWWIILPSHPDIGTPGHPGELSWRTTDLSRDGKLWTVTGTAPLLTVTPSIDVWRFVRGADGLHVRDGSYWHGFITNGFLV